MGLLPWRKDSQNGRTEKVDENGIHDGYAHKKKKTAELSQRFGSTRLSNILKTPIQRKALKPQSHSDLEGENLGSLEKSNPPKEVL